MVIGIDHGYYAIKTKQVCFPTGIIRYEYEPYTMQNVLQYQGEYYVCGTGRQTLVKDKTANDNYYLLTLAALAQEIRKRKGERTAKVVLAAGLPLTGFGREKQKFKEYLFRKEQPIRFFYEGERYEIQIEDVKLFPQGYSALALYPEYLKDEPSVLLVDIGGWTVDLMRLDNAVPNAATCRSLELGVIRCMDEILEQVRRNTGLSVTETQIERVGHCEVDAYADKNYRLLFDTEGEWFCNDARTIETERMPDFDLLCAGFPCQAFSIAGKREGFADARGTLFFEIARLVADKRPAYFILENVPGLLSHDKGRTFHTILSTLSELGYGVEWKVLNSKDFGVPQSRKRVYLVGYLDRRCAGKILPFPTANGTPLVQIQTGRQGERIYKAEGLSCTLTSGAGGVGGKTGLYEVGVPIKENTKQGYKMAYPGDSIDLGYAGLNTRRGRVGHQIAHTLTTGIQQGTLHFVDLSPPPLVTEHCRCLNTRQSGIHNHKGECSGVLKEEGARAVLNPGREETRQNGRRMKEPEEPMFTITATDRHGVTYRGRIRRLVPRECLRLQGFYDWQIDRIEQETSDSQLYKQAGNGVTVNVIEAIGTLLRQADTEIRAEDEKTKR